jgi:HK97 family phage prohead protease
MSDETQDTELEQRAMEECPTCKGTGKVDGEECPDCNGTGEVSSTAGQQQNEANPELEQRKALAELLDGTPLHRDFDADMELRATTDEGILHLSGYASTTETPYEVQDFTETIARGAFKRTLGETPDVVLLINHDGIPLARTKSGTLTLSEDARGLRVDADLDAKNPLVQNLVSPMQRGDMDEMSFAFRPTQQDWNEDYTERTIREVSIHRGDVSMVTHGANSDTLGTVSIRSADAEAEEEKPPEEKPEPPITRSYIEIAKARRAKLRRSR